MSLLQPITKLIKLPQELPKKRGRGRPRKYKKDVPKKLKKRGRKRKIEKQIYNLNNLKEIEIKSKDIERKSIIVHLPINIKEFEENNNKIFETDFLNYDPLMNLKEPQGFDLGIDFSLMNIEHETITNVIKENKQEREYNIIDNDNIVTKKINNIMMEFSSFNDKKYFKTDICCWHCCYKFENMPCGIPLTYDKDAESANNKIKGIFNVKGVFCSFNCALTYNYNSKETENQIQERESLLYLMYKKIHNVKEVDLKYAPEKETLQMFGGTLTIEEFRKNQNIYKIVHPPMLSIIPQLEEIKILETSNHTNLSLNTKNNKKYKKNTFNQLFQKSF